MFLRAIELFSGVVFRGAEIGQIILAVDPRKLEEFQLRWGDQLNFQGVDLIAGGTAERWETVQIALSHVKGEATHVAVHDAARPCASVEMIERVFTAADKYGAALPGLAMGDTVKRVERERLEGASRDKVQTSDPLDTILRGETSELGQVRKIAETVDRSGLYRVQTPQVFEKGLIVEAYAALSAENAAGVTDDASVVERAGHDVFIAEGDAMNMKLTSPGDVALMEAVLRMRDEKSAKDRAVKQLFGDDDD